MEGGDRGREGGTGRRGRGKGRRGREGKLLSGCKEKEKKNYNTVKNEVISFIEK